MVEPLAFFGDPPHEEFKVTPDIPGPSKQDSIWHVACFTITQTAEKEDHQ